MPLASWVLNRQLMVARAAFRSVTRAWTSRRRAGSFGDALLEAGAGQHAELDFRHIQPTPVLGGVVELQPFGDPAGLGRWEGLVQGSCPVGVQIVQDHSHHRDLWIGLIHQPAHLAGEVLHGAPLRNLHVAPTGHRFAGQEQVSSALPAVLVVLPRRSPRLGWQRGTGGQPTTGSKSRQSRPPAAAGHRVGRTGPARPPCGPRTRRSPWGCTTPASATA